MKVGILTYHRSINYGAYIQAYCLQKELSKKTGFSVEIIDYDSKAAFKYYKKELILNSLRKMIFNIRRYRMFSHAQRNLPLSSDSLITDDINELNIFLQNKYDIIIVGSDEVWKIGGFRPFPNAYWLPELTSVRKLTYAVSSRINNQDLNSDIKNALKKYINEFDFITVRDSITKQMVDEFLSDEKKSLLVCDPTMAYDFSFDLEEGKKLLRDKFHVCFNKKIIAIMDSTGEIVRNLNKNESVQFISLYSYFNGIRSNPNIKPEEWVQIIAAVDGLITSFFHGMCIAINSNTPFLYCEEREIEADDYSKGYDLLHRNGLDNHYLIYNDINIKDKFDAFIYKIMTEQKREDYSKVKRNEKIKFDMFVNYMKSNG